METSIRTIKFPNFSQNAANFPNSMGPGPNPKKGCESPASFDPRGLIGRINVGHHLTLLHTCTKYKSCGPHGFRDVFPL